MQQLSYQAEWQSLTPGEQGHTLPILLSHAEVRQLTQASPALRTLYATAGRPEHILAMKAADLQQQGVQLDGRWHPLDPHTAAILQVRALTRPEQLFEPHEWLEPLSQSPAALRYQAVGRSLTPMALRHAAATHLLEQGMDLFVLHTLLNHQNLGCTRKYLELAVSLRGADYARCHPLMADQRSPVLWRGPGSQDVDEEEDDEESAEAEPRVARPNHAEVQSLIAAATNLRDRAMLRAYYATGARANELLNARCEDLCEEEGRLFLRDGKGDKDRLVLLDPKTIRLLRQWGGKEGRLIGIKIVRAGEIFRDCALRSGLRQKYGRALRLHSLRHAFATQLYQNGMPLGSLKRLLGHDRLATTVVYLDCPWERCLSQIQAALP